MLVESDAKEALAGSRELSRDRSEWRSDPPDGGTQGVIRRGVAGHGGGVRAGVAGQEVLDMPTERSKADCSGRGLWPKRKPRVPLSRPPLPRWKEDPAPALALAPSLRGRRVRWSSERVVYKDDVSADIPAEADANAPADAPADADADAEADDDDDDADGPGELVDRSCWRYRSNPSSTTE